MFYTYMINQQMHTYKYVQSCIIIIQRFVFDPSCDHH